MDYDPTEDDTREVQAERREELRDMKREAAAEYAFERDSGAAP